MPKRLQCSCGKNLQVGDNFTGRRVRCPGCQSVLEVNEPEEATFLEEVDPVEEESEREIDEEPTGKGQSVCYFCRTKKVKVVSFWSGIKEEKIEVRNRNNDLVPDYIYSNLMRHDVPACVPCMRRLWLKHYLMLFVIYSGVTALLFLLVVGGWASVIGTRGPKPILGLYYLTFFFIACAGFLVLVTWRLFFSKLKRGLMEDVLLTAIGKEVRPVAHDALLTTTQVKELQTHQVQGERIITGKLVQPPRRKIVRTPD